MTGADCALVSSAEGHVDRAITVDEARACLFKIQRAFRYRAEVSGPDDDLGPYADEILFAWSLVEHIRERVSQP